MAAEAVMSKLLAALELHPAGNELRVSLSLLSFMERLQLKLSAYHQVGRSCCGPRPPNTFCLYRSSADCFIEGCFDLNDPRLFHYYLRVKIPAKLTNVFAVTFEDELAPLWNGLLAKAPSRLRCSKGLYTVLRSQVSLLGGFSKFEGLNEIHRYVDTEAGMLVEQLLPVKEGHADYHPPSDGFRRASVEIESMWVACGEQQTVLLQAGTVCLPWAISRFMACSVGSLVGKHVISSLVQDSMRSSGPGNPWQSAISKDESGMYTRLDQCVHSEESRRRERNQDTEHLSAQLQKHFSRRLFSN